MTDYCMDCKSASYWNEDELYCSHLQFCVKYLEPICELFEEKFTGEQKKFMELAKQIMEEDRDLLIALRDS